MIVIVSQAYGIHILNLKQSMNENEGEEEKISPSFQNSGKVFALLLLLRFGSF